MVKNMTFKLGMNVTLLSLEPMCFRVMVNGMLKDDTPILQLEALRVGNGIAVTDIEVLDEKARPQSFTLSENQIHISVSPFQLRYTVQSQYQACMGADRRFYFTYPFANETEFFIGTGVLPFPVALPEIAAALEVSITVTGLPDGWQIFSNGLLDHPHPAKLDGFFLYAAPLPPAFVHHYLEQGDRVTMHLLVQRGRALPLSFERITIFMDETLTWLEQHLAPYRQASPLNILFLQAPTDFEIQTNGLAFATGENVLNGIITYAPYDARYLERLFGESDYGFFLLDGLAHELVHTYTTTVWQGQYKAMLYPAPDCPSQIAHLLGETLAGYVHRLYMHERIQAASDSPFPAAFMALDVARALEQQKSRGRNHPFLDLFLFDQELHRYGCSLVALLGTILREQMGTPLSYNGIDFLLEWLDAKWGIRLGERGRELLLPHFTPDYSALLQAR